MSSTPTVMPLMKCVLKCNGSDLKGNVVDTRSQTSHGLPSRTRLDPLEPIPTERSLPGLALDNAKLRQQGVHAPFAMPGDHQHHAEDGQDHDDSQLKVLATMQKTIPRPKMLRERRGDERYRRQHQKKASNPY